MALVAACINPSGYSYFHWLVQDTTHFLVAKIGVGLLLSAAGVFYVRATWLALGVLGVTLVLGLLVALAWALIEFKWLRLDARMAVGWVVVVAVASLLAVGLSWAQVRHRMSLDQ